MTTAKNALKRLIKGNQHFAAGRFDPDNISPNKRAHLADGQAPFAIVVGCSDSRVPAELIFNQGLGDLFVVRVAGNIVDETVAGSVEFAASKFGCRLVVVLGHSSCGAIEATLNEMAQPSQNLSANIRVIVEAVTGALRSLKTEGPDIERNELLCKAVRTNVMHWVGQLRNKSSVLAPLVDDGTLTIVGAQYDLETGQVEFFHEYKQ